MAPEADSDVLDSKELPFESFASAQLRGTDDLADPKTVGQLRESGAEIPGASAPAPPATDQPSPAEPTRPTAADAASSPAVPEQKRYRVGDREFTAEEIAKSPDLIEKLAVTHGKYGHLAEIRERERQQHVEMLERLIADRTAPGGQQPAGPGYDPKQLTREIANVYTPQRIMERIELAGLGDRFADFADAYPEVSAYAFYLADLVNGMGREVAQLLAWRVGVEDGGRTGQFISARDSAIDALAKEEEFAWLGDSSERGRFLEYLANVNPLSTQVTDLEGLAALALGFKQPIIRQTLKTTRERATAATTATQRAAMAPRPTAAGRPGTPGVPANADDANFQALAAAGRGR